MASWELLSRRREELQELRPVKVRHGGMHGGFVLWGSFITAVVAPNAGSRQKGSVSRLRQESMVSSEYDYNI
jgi:hypothetical protein